MRIIPVALFLITIPIILYFISTEREGLDIKHMVKGSQMRSVKIMHFTDKKQDWDAQVEEAIFRPGNDMVDLRHVKLNYPDRDLQLRAKNGLYDLRSGRIQLENDIEGTIKGTEFKSARISYNPLKNIIIAKDGLVIKGRKFRITGNSGKIVGNNLMKIEGNVRAVFYK